MFYFPNSNYQQNFTQYPQNYPQYPQVNQNPQPQTILLHVPTSKDFDSVAIQPGKSALILAQNEPYMVLKPADGMGAISSTYYKYEAVDVSQMGAPATEYATKAEVQQLQEIVQRMLIGGTNESNGSNGNAQGQKSGTGSLSADGSESAV